MIIAEEIKEYLARDEVIEKEFYLRGRFAVSGYMVYATNKRLFIVRGNSIKDIDCRFSVFSCWYRSVASTVYGLVDLGTYRFGTDCVHIGANKNTVYGASCGRGCRC
jgi:hypothetical protein